MIIAHAAFFASGNASLKLALRTCTTSDKHAAKSGAHCSSVRPRRCSSISRSSSAPSATPVLVGTNRATSTGIRWESVFGAVPGTRSKKSVVSVIASSRHFSTGSAKSLRTSGLRACAHSESSTSAGWGE